MMFCLGMNAMLAQLVMTRELMVAFYGNELAIGIIFAVWLIMVGAGSMLIRPFAGRLGENNVRWMAVGLLVIMAVALPLLIFAARSLRMIFNVPMGEYMVPGRMLAAAGLVLSPVCIIIGMLFPGACRLAAYRNGGVAGVFAAESAGSMVAGISFSFVFVYVFSPMRIAILAAFCSVCGAALIAPRTAGRTLCWSIAVCLAVLLFFPRPADILEMDGIRLRWESFGILPRNTALSGKTPRLVDARDSKYQNLVLIKSEGQFTLYGNGQVIFVFPDAISGEQKIHFVMAQKPDARRVLLLGGNPVDEVPELLKYPLERLTHVELDEVIGEMLAPVAGADYRRATSDPRLRQSLMDGPRFVKQCRDRFDVVIVEAPEPTTIALNRFYTVEFYRDLSRILAPGGFVYASIESSEHLQDEAANMAASVYKALRSVFPRVLVSAGRRNQFFAGENDAPLTFDGNTLCRRWKSAGIATKYFRPEYFLNADEISSEKTEYVLKRITSVPAPANSALRPVSAFYNLSLWNRYSGSRMGAILNLLKGLRIERAGGALAAFEMLVLILVVTAVRRKSARLRRSAVDSGRAGRGIVAAVIAVTGFTGMALELILVFMFQTLLGYVYAGIGIIIAMFMLGLATGAVCARRYAGKTLRRRRLLFIGLDAVLLLMAIGLPILMKSSPGLGGTGAAAVIYFLALLTGWAGGAQFILAAILLNNENYGEDQAQIMEGRVPRNAALLNALDLAGAALGGISIGVILLPLFGLGGVCCLLAILKAGTLALLGVFLVFADAGV